jgi:hypothetical protein
MKRAKKRRPYAFSVWVRDVDGSLRRFRYRIWTSQPMPMPVSNDWVAPTDYEFAELQRDPYTMFKRPATEPPKP